VASDRPPSAIPGLEGRLASRFQWGLVADIQPPDEETRLAILQAKAKEQRVEIPDEVSGYLADRCATTSGPGRMLEPRGGVCAADARDQPEAATKALAALAPAAASPADRAILQSVSAYYGVSLRRSREEPGQADRRSAPRRRPSPRGRRACVEADRSLWDTATTRPSSGVQVTNC
jgi:chromosomal replication initiator protein